MVQGRAIVTMAVVYDLSISTNLNDLERAVT